MTTLTTGLVITPAVIMQLEGRAVAEHHLVLAVGAVVERAGVDRLAAVHRRAAVLPAVEVVMAIPLPVLTATPGMLTGACVRTGTTTTR